MAKNLNASKSNHRNIKSDTEVIKSLLIISIYLKQDLGNTTPNNKLNHELTRFLHVGGEPMHERGIGHPKGEDVALRKWNLDTRGYARRGTDLVGGRRGYRSRRG